MTTQHRMPTKGGRTAKLPSSVRYHFPDVAQGYLGGPQTLPFRPAASKAPPQAGACNRNEYDPGRFQRQPVFGAEYGSI